jgi:hypothetical protein
MRRCKVCGTNYVLIDGTWERQQDGDREHGCWGQTLKLDDCDKIVEMGEMEEVE